MTSCFTYPQGNLLEHYVTADVTNQVIGHVGSFHNMVAKAVGAA